MRILIFDLNDPYDGYREFEHFVVFAILSCRSLCATVGKISTVLSIDRVAGYQNESFERQHFI